MVALPAEVTVTVSANGFTVTVLVPTAALLTTEVALMVSVPPAVSSSPTVSKPLVLMAVLEDVLPDTAQVTPGALRPMNPHPARLR